MTVIEAVILGIIQGLTEFIPVSSSGHLVLVEKLLGVGDGSLTFDVALHGGTLLALIIMFRRDIVRLLRAFFITSPETKLARLLALATIPAVISGLLLEGYAENVFRSTSLVAVNLAIVAIFMLLAERQLSKVEKPTKLKNTTGKQAGVVGLAQALAMIPGVSRSGSTITAGLFMGMDRVAATRFSFLLGIPIISGALLKTVLSSNGLSQIQAEPWMFFFGILAALISGLFAIRFMLKYLAKHTLAIFAYYRLAAATVVILFTLFN